MTLPHLLLQGKVIVNQPSCNHLQQAGPVDLKDGSRLVLRTALQTVSLTHRFFINLFVNIQLSLAQGL